MILRWSFYHQRIKDKQINIKISGRFFKRQGSFHAENEIKNVVYNIVRELQVTFDESKTLSKKDGYIITIMNNEERDEKDLIKIILDFPSVPKYLSH